MASPKEILAEQRARRPWLDHVLSMNEHYGRVKGGQQAGAVTYFAFLSFFPILALAFAIFGQVTKVYEDAQDTLVDAANSVLPNLVGGENGVPLDTLQAAAPGIFSVGILLTLYSGLGWLSGMRSALMAIFEEPEREQPSFLFGKLRDVLALMALGTILVASVAVSGVAGVWWWSGSSGRHDRLDANDDLALTICYLDAPPVEVAAALAPVLEERWRGGPVPRLAGLFVAVDPQRIGDHLP
jgi:membrane protein